MTTATPIVAPAAMATDTATIADCAAVEMPAPVGGSSGWVDGERRGGGGGGEAGGGGGGAGEQSSMDTFIFFLRWPPQAR